MNSKQEPQAGRTDRLAPIQSFPNRLFPSGLAPIRLTTCKLVQEDSNNQVALFQSQVASNPSNE